MKIFKYLSALVIGAAAMTGCQDKFDETELEVPVATLEANISIADFKAMFWQDEAANYCDEIPAQEDGSHYVIKGRVISSDYDGNVFKKLIICDGTAALAMSINQYNLYLTHRMGQELVIDLTGMYAGKYAGCFQLGFPSWYANGNTWQTSFMAPELFNAHCELNGLPEPDAAEAQPMLIENFSSIGSSPAELQYWQSRLVRINNVKFANAGVEGEMLCANYKTSVSAEQNQALNVGDTQLTVRTSGYSNFWNTPLPAEEFDIVGILDYYNGSWQLILNSVDGLMNIGNPTNKGAQNDPYSVKEAAALAAAGNTSGWVKGYIIGTLAPEVTEVKSLDDIWTAEPFIMNNSLIIVDDVDNYTIDDIMLITLPQGTPLAEYGNLVDNENLGKWINIQGRFTKEMGTSAVINNTGTPSTFEIEGIEIEDPNAPVESGDGTEAHPYNVTQVISLGNPGTTAWVEGYIVGFYDYDNNSALATTATGASASNVAIAADPNETDKNKTVAVQLPVGDIRSAVNLLDHPENLGKKLAIQGTLTKYFGLPGVKDGTAYKLNGEGNGGNGGDDTPSTPSTGSGDGSKDSPYNCASVISLNNPGTAAWVKGYIVGYYDYDQNSALIPGAGSVQTNIALADDPNETDKNKTVAIQLPVGDIRTALNLLDHPENVGKQLIIQGSLIKYFGLPGVKDPTAYELEGGSQTPDEPVTPPSGDTNGDGTEGNPYDVADIISLNCLDGSISGWTEGYIVGSMVNSAALFGAEGAAATNLVLAPSASETDYNKCIPVELPAGDIRKALNLQDNPANLGKKIEINATLTKYFSRAGLKKPTSYKDL